MNQIENMLPENDADFMALQTLAEGIRPNPQFTSKLEADLKSAHRPRAHFHLNRRDVLQFAGLTMALAALAFFLNWAFRSIAPVRIPAGPETATPISMAATPTPITSEEILPVPQGVAYDYNGNTLYLKADLPSLPIEANIYTAQPDQHATIESARALALRFGIEGQVYETPGEIPGTTDYLVTAGGPRLYVRSDNYFSYYRTYGGIYLGSRTLTTEQAAAAIADFMQARGFDFEYTIVPAPQVYGAYYVTPMLDGQPLRYTYLMPARLEITLDDNGQVLQVYGSLLSAEKVGAYGIRTAEEAFQQIVNVEEYGILQAMRSGGMVEMKLWTREYPEAESMTLYGLIRSLPAAEPGQPPLITLSDFTLTGNTVGLESIQEDVLIEANGQFITQNGVGLFQVDSWKVSEAQAFTAMGSLRKEGDQVILVAEDGSEVPLVNVPADVPLNTQSPQEYMSVDGTLVNGQLEWKFIQYMPVPGGGGGGGGGGMGLYQLNLTGTPMPLPTPGPTLPSTGGGGGGSGYMYTIVEGDTCQGIATTFNVPVEDLIAANGLPVDCSTLQVDQTLTVQLAPPVYPQTVEGLRGILMVNLYNRPDGSQRTEYALITANLDYPYVVLEGSGLDALYGYRNRPVDVWGAQEASEYGIFTVQVERFEIPFPGLDFQILKGTEQTAEVDDQAVLLFTTEDGQTFLELNSDCNSPALPESALTADQSAILVETLTIPDLTWGGYPTVCMHSKSPAFDSRGQAIELQVAANQPYVMDDPAAYVAPTLTIEKVELVYFIKDPRYPVANASSSPAYVQPMWRFYGHYSNGDEFEFLVQALKDEFLSPEIQSIELPG
jgi:hypothetical protein